MSTRRKMIPFPERTVDPLTKIETNVRGIGRRVAALGEALRSIGASPSPEIGGMLEEIAPTREPAQAAPVEMPANVVPLFSPERMGEIEWQERLQRLGVAARESEAFLARERRSAALTSAGRAVDAIRERQNMLPAAIEYIQHHSDNAGRYIAPVLARIESAREGRQ